MRILRYSAATLSAAIVAVTMCVGAAYAMSPDQMTHGVTDHTIFKAGNSVTITGTVNGDIFCAGQTVTINATVNGDVICAAQSVDIDGVVNGSVRVAAQTIHIGATVERNLSLAGQTVVVSRSARVMQDASIASETLTVDGAVGRDLYSAATSVAMNGPVGRDASVWAQDVNLSSMAVLSGKLDYTSPHPYTNDAGGSVSGTISYHKYVPKNTDQSSGTSLIGAKLYWLVAMIVLGLVLVALFGNVFTQWNVGRNVSLWRALLVGFVAMVAMPMLVILLALTLVGIPLAVVVILLWVVVCMVSMPFSGYFLGSLLLPKQHQLIKVLAGSAVIGFVGLLPILGWMVGLVSYWLGSGIVLLGLQKAYTRARVPATTS